MACVLHVGSLYYMDINLHCIGLVIPSSQMGLSGDVTENLRHINSKAVIPKHGKRLHIIAALQV